MASELYVETLKGLTSGANANKVIIPAGQTLDIAGDWTPPAGTVLQVVSETYTTRFYTNSTSYVDTGFSVDITPTSSSSKILIIGHSVAGISDAGYSVHVRLGGTTSTNFYGTSTSNSEQQNTVSKKLAHTYGSDSISLSFLDSPASTSTQSYHWRLKSSSGGVNVMLGGAWSNDSNVGNGITTLTVMEIAG